MEGGAKVQRYSVKFSKVTDQAILGGMIVMQIKYPEGLNDIIKLLSSYNFVLCLLGGM